MKVTYDQEVNAAYIYLRQNFSYVAKEITQIQPPDKDGEIILDFDEAGRLIGIEVLNASEVLPPELIEQAELL